MDYGSGPSRALIIVTNICEVYEDDEDCKDQEDDEDCDDESAGDGDGDVQADGHVLPFLNLHQLTENVQGRYVSVDMESCSVSNNLNPKGPKERGTIKYHLALSPQFENVKNFGNVVSSVWTPWVNYNNTNSSGELLACHVFTSKVSLQDALKLYSIKAHQQYVIIVSSKQLLVVRCKKAEQCQCPWKLHDMVVKNTIYFIG